MEQKDDLAYSEKQQSETQAQYNPDRFPQGTQQQPVVVQIVQMAKEPGCGCCGARNGLIIWLALVIGFGIISLATSVGQTTIYHVAQSFVILGSIFPLYVLIVNDVNRIRSSAWFFVSCQVINWISLIVNAVIMAKDLKNRGSIITFTVIVLVIGVLYSAIIVNRLLAVHKYWVERNLPSNVELNRVI